MVLLCHFSQVATFNPASTADKLRAEVLQEILTRLSGIRLRPLARRATLDSLTRYIASDISADRADA